MAKKRDQNIEGAQVLSGDNRKNGKPSKPRQPGITPEDFWEEAFPGMPWANNIDKILEIPTTADMAGIFARANFRSDRQRVAAVRLAYKNRRANDENHQIMLRDYIASGIGMSGLGKLMQLMAGTNLIAPEVLRESLGMTKKKKKNDETVYRGSDFRQEGYEQEERS